MSLEKDEVYLKNVEKIGNSSNNINVSSNVLSKEDHEKLVNFSLGVESWTKKPWGVYVLSSEDIPEEISKILSKIFKIAHKKMTFLYKVAVDPIGESKFNIVKFEEGYSMHLHADTMSQAQFHLASVYYVNDDYDGGEISFPDHGIKIKPKANSLIIFPGNEDYKHETLKVVGNSRYTSTMFFQFTGSDFSGVSGDGTSYA